MKAQFYHAHEGLCVVPPTDGWCCPYTSQASADAARPTFPMYATAYAFKVLSNLTTAEFSIGGDRPARDTIEALSLTLCGQQLDQGDGAPNRAWRVQVDGITVEVVFRPRWQSEGHVRGDMIDQGLAPTLTVTDASAAYENDRRLYHVA